MDKASFRENARLYRKTIDPHSEDAEALFDVFCEAVQPSKSNIIAAYWPMGTEIDTRFLIDDLIHAGYQVSLPITPTIEERERTGRALTFRLWNGESNLIDGAFGTKVPPDGALAEPDIFLIPLLAFDRKGNRMGQGQGYYDATLEKARANKQILAVGVGYAAQSVLFDLPTEPHDQRLDMVLTPNGMQDFR